MASQDTQGNVQDFWRVFMAQLTKLNMEAGENISSYENISVVKRSNDNLCAVLETTSQSTCNA